MGRDSIPKFFNRLRKKHGNENNKDATLAVELAGGPGVPVKPAHRWQRRKLHEQAFERKRQEQVTQNKVDPWFANISHPRRDSVTVLFDFPAAKDADAKACVCLKGDHLSVVSDRTNSWWEVTNSRTHEDGFIPANYVIEERGVDDILDAWHDIDRRECEAKLGMQGLPNGTYMFRPSSNSLRMALSVIFTFGKKHKIKHFKVENDDALGGFFINPSKGFARLSDLVSYYKTAKNGFTSLLSDPWPRTELPTIQSRTVEIPRSCISLNKKLGKGSFGSVYLATYNGSEVAVETIRSHSSSIAHELALTHRLYHESIVRTLGVCFKPTNEPIYLVKDYLPVGSLKNYMSATTKQRISYKKIIVLLYQIVDGMNYLEDQSVVHGDLRTANVFLTKEFIAKVGNFGLSQIGSMDSIQKRKKASLRWAPPESSKQPYELNSTYDAWSFGVLMFEMFTCGKTPYDDLEDDEIVKKLETGYRLSKPSSLGYKCEQEIDGLMHSCMEIDPEMRPSFRELWFVFDEYFHGGSNVYDILE